MYNFNEDEIRRHFLDFMRSVGIVWLDNRDAIMDGRIHRFKVQGDARGQRSGAYCVWIDGWPSGWVQDWRMGDPIKWVFPRDCLNEEGKKHFSDEKAYQDALERSRERAKKRNKELEHIQLRAADVAQSRFNTFGPAPEDHPYLVAKHVRNLGLRWEHDNVNNNLAVPLYDINGRLWSYQSIYPNGDKKFYPDAPTKGRFFSIALDTLKGNQDDIICVGEGYGTIATVYDLTGFPSVAAMNCYNLRPVCEALKSKYPDARIIIMADNDAKTPNNPGITKANEAQQSLALQGVVYPEFDDAHDGTDWNDYAQAYGEEKAQEILRKKIFWVCLSEKQKQEYSKREKLQGLVQLLDPTVTIPPQEFIGGLFPRAYVSILAAPSGTGKTIFMQKFVSDLSIGGSIFDGFADDEPVRTSLILAGEAGYELLIRRGAALRWPINPQNVKVVDQFKAEASDIPILLSDAEGWCNVLRLYDIYKPDIIFVDTFSSFHDRDENKASEMKPIIKNLAMLARENNIAIVLVHHSRKRTAKERVLSLNQDDVIGSSILNRLVGLIVGIEPMKDDEKTLLVRPLKTWFSAFMPFTYRLTEDFYGHPVMQTDLAPAEVNSSRIAVWRYLCEAFPAGEWFSLGQIVLSEIDGNVSERQIKRILAEFLKNGKLDKRGSTRGTEYSIVQNSKEE